MVFLPGQYPHCQVDWLIGVRFPKCLPAEAVLPVGIAGHLGLYTPHLAHKYGQCAGVAPIFSYKKVA